MSFFCAVVGVRAQVDGQEGRTDQGKREERRRNQHCKGKQRSGDESKGLGVGLTVWSLERGAEVVGKGVAVAGPYGIRAGP